MATSEWTNADRRARATQALKSYADEQDGAINVTTVSDLLSDLMHLAEKEAIDFELALDRAKVNYECEVLEEA